jgi:restriction system protein
VTGEGENAYTRFEDPEKFMRESHRLYKQWAESRPEGDSEVPEDRAESTSTIEEAEEAAWSEISQHLKSMNPYDFQNLVAALLRAMGYSVSWVAPPGPDKGIDILAHTDPLGTSVPRIKVQVKRREDKVNVEGLRSFMALLGDQDVGIFVSTGGFTSDAESEARTQEKRKVTLLDLEKLFDLWVQHYEKVAESDKRLLPLKPVYYLAPSE